MPVHSRYTFYPLMPVHSERAKLMICFSGLFVFYAVDASVALSLLLKCTLQIKGNLKKTKQNIVNYFYE